MTRAVALVALAVGSLFVPGLVHHAQAQECSVATLQGEYLVTGGWEPRLDQRDDPAFPERIVAVWNFDGEGGLTGFTIRNRGGEIIRDDLNATYTMDADRCVATVTFGAPVVTAVWDAVMARDGSEGAAIEVQRGPEPGNANIGTRYLKKR